MSSIISGVLSSTWPMILVSVVVATSLRLTYLVKNHIHFTFYKEVFMLVAIVYVLELFQIVTSGDVVSWSTNNFIPFKEMFRYRIGSPLFIKNVIGNIVLFMPYGFFIGFYLKEDKARFILLLTLLVSVTIECVQMSIGRVFDVDDILLNTLGGFIGAKVYILLVKLTNHIPAFFKSEFFLNIVAFVALLGFFILI